MVQGSVYRLLFIAVLVLGSFVVCGMSITLHDNQYHDITKILRERYYASYEDRCMSLPFIHDYLSQLYAETSTATNAFTKLASFVFINDIKHRAIRLGGFGDRFAGLLSTFFWSLRNKRLLLVEDPQGTVSAHFGPLPKSLYKILLSRRRDRDRSFSSPTSLWQAYYESIILPQTSSLQQNHPSTSFFRKERQPSFSSSSTPSWNHWYSFLEHSSIREVLNMSDSQQYRHCVASHFKHQRIPLSSSQTTQQQQQQQQQTHTHTIAAAAAAAADHNDYSCLWPHSSSSSRHHANVGKAKEYSCVNPEVHKAHQRHCLLDDATNSTTCSSTAIDGDGSEWIRVRHNRAYLCHWLKHSTATQQCARQQLRSYATFIQRNVHSSSSASSLSMDLSLWSGCVLRTLFWPQEYLWQRIDQYIRMNLRSADSETRFLGVGVNVVGLHYRCGDHNYDGARHVSSPNGKYQACSSSAISKGGSSDSNTSNNSVFNSVNNRNRSDARIGTAEQRAFSGTAPLDEWSSASPRDFPVCARRVSSKRVSDDTNGGNGGGSVIRTLYIVASDAPDATEEIKEALLQQQEDQALLLTLPNGCHVDYDHSKACMEHTLLSWTMLGMSDRLVVQRIDEAQKTRPSRQQQQQQQQTPPLMVSSFSRSAMWYSLGGNRNSRIDGNASAAGLGLGVESMLIFAERRSSQASHCHEILSASNSNDGGGGGGVERFNPYNLLTQGNWQCD